MYKKYLFIAVFCIGTTFVTPTASYVCASTAVTTTSSSVNTRSKSYDNLGMSIANSYLNIRSKASTSSKVVGKLYRGSVATIEKIDGDWAKVTSGSVSGYVAKQYLAIGSDAQKLFVQYANPVATVTATSLRVRKSNSTSSKILGLVSKGQKFQVLKRGSKWTKIKYKKKKGYVSNDYIKLSYNFEYAVSVQEEQENIDQELAADKDTGSSGSMDTNKPESDGTTGAKIAAYAQQFVGNPYVWGGTSLTKGADCSGFLQTLFKKFGYSIPRTSRQQAVAGSKVSTKNRKPGDIVSYASSGVVNHVALYIGNDKVIHASTPKDGIKISKYNYRSIHSIRRIVS